MARLDHKKPSMALYENILKLKNVDECRQFFEDLCTVSEARAMEQRFDVAVLLTEGKIYNEILGCTGEQRDHQPRQPHAVRRHRRAAQHDRTDCKRGRGQVRGEIFISSL